MIYSIQNYEGSFKGKLCSLLKVNYVFYLSNKHKYVNNKNKKNYIYIYNERYGWNNKFCAHLYHLNFFSLYSCVNISFIDDLILSCTTLFVFKKENPA